MTATAHRPPIPYFGGKTRLAPLITATFPPHEHYVDPAGSTTSMPGYLTGYAELYQGWHVTRIDTTTGQGGTRQQRTEVLWSNRLPEQSLFDLEVSV